MISETYLKLLKSEVKKIDNLTNSTYELEAILQDIVDNVKNADLEFIKRLGNLTTKETFSKMKDKQTSILELLYKYLGSRVIDTDYLILKETKKNKSFEALANDLKSLIGLENVKKEIEDLVAFNKVQQSREKIGLKKTNRTMHMAFLGNPGTGKTTVARIVGNMYRSLGILSKGHFIEASRTDLIAEYQGQTALKVKRLIQKAKGGVLFIDEAYSITENDKSDSYGRECLTELTKALEDYREDLVVIVAGYDELMKKFFESNPGLKSRFNYFITFEDYTVDQMFDIFLSYCKNEEYNLHDSAKETLKKYLELHSSNSENKNANGRFVRNVFDKIIMNQAKRLSNLSFATKENYVTILEDDIF
ncbi:AAA family ATPase, putative [Streptococcus oralis Uo5]|uniref:AAA family ATPase, putative n=1 Tax=Streptococcus oralis (strain Uo5) TaxID=927666 RepID=F2QCZ5_STROU|nr:AAA family ATPase [Streptococcus oralis]CBZ00513.1 AAA family ATPase, putative [Streptococcus oralis Uo5]